MKSNRERVAIRLLGPPRIERDGAVMPPPRGKKAWGLLAYLALAERPPTRGHLATLLFPEAEDPLGALRWSLSELRRALNAPEALRGDPLDLDLGDIAIDVVEPDAAGSGELLEGLSFPSSPLFDAWLAVERRHLAGLVESMLRETTLARLASGDPHGAVELARRLVELDPTEQGAQELLIRCLARSGDAAGARLQLAACEQLFQRVLGTRPGPELERAAGEQPETAVGAGDAAVALGQLRAGEAALQAGAVEPGVDCLRLACSEAASCGDDSLRARCLVALGTALVHAVRGHDEEGAAALHEGLAVAERSGDSGIAATACREIGYADVLAGRGTAAVRWLGRATALAGDADEELCVVTGFRGMALSDRAHYGPALTLFEESIMRAERCGQLRQAAWSLSNVGRLHLLRGNFGDSADALDRSLELVAREAWTAFHPWPETLRAELWLRTGRPDLAAELVDHGFRLACKLGDPCWEASSARLRGLLLAGQGDVSEGMRWLRSARDRAIRLSDPYQWVHAYVLDALAATAIDAGAPDAPEAVDALTGLAERANFRELVVRAHIHRARLGDTTSLATAKLLAAEIENAALSNLLEAESLTRSLTRAPA